jgi:LAO/AO transport system kinase
MIAINKSDIDIDKSKLAAQQFRNALHLFPMPDSQWTVPVVLCSAYSKMGIQDIWNNILEYVAFTKSNGYFYEKRRQQSLRILDETIENALKERFYNAPGMEDKLEEIKKEILENKVSAYAAAERLVEGC